MVTHDTLSSVLSDFARTLITDFPIQGILDHLVERIVDVLPISGAGVTLISPGMAPQYVAASNEKALRYEQLQTSLAQGPCLLAYHTGEAVSVPDLRLDDRFPVFGPEALSHGMRAVFTFPLRHGEGRLGALDLYRDHAGALDEGDLGVAQTLADVTSAYLLNARARQQEREAAERFRESSLHDPLTGLPNRALLHQRLEHAAARARRTHSTAAVLFLDLDRFKRINDTFGHAVGDELLMAVARRLSSVVRPGDTLARLSGDEFVVLCEDMSHVEDVEILAKRIEGAFHRPFELETTVVAITASVGIAYAGPGGDVPKQLLANADIAMYQAKRSGGGSHQVIDLRAARNARTREHLERDLRNALTRSELHLAYQPIVRTRDGLVVGVEALLRWTHPERGLVPAVTVISIAEQSELISEIGAWVLERACRDRARWLAASPDQPLDLSVNVSARQIVGSGFSADVAGVLERTAMDPTALTLEVTESIFIEDRTRATGVLAYLKSLGVHVALDDFGTGYCSLGYLQQFPVDMVKIDQSFVADIGAGHTAPIAAAIADLAHALGLRVTAEGVETVEQQRGVATIGCELAQGYLYARPISASDVGALLHGSDRDLLHLPSSRVAAAAL